MSCCNLFIKFVEDFSEGFNEEDDLEIELDVNRHTLTFIFNDKAFATITQLQGNSFYPFLIFHKTAFVPVQINYSKGPRGEYQILFIPSRCRNFFNGLYSVSDFGCLHVLTMITMNYKMLRRN